jgi:hypothetical protein
MVGGATKSVTIAASGNGSRIIRLVSIVTADAKQWTKNGEEHGTGRQEQNCRDAESAFCLARGLERLGVGGGW